MITLLQAAGTASSLPTIIMLVAMFAIMYFFMIRPQSQKQKKIQKFRDALTVGQDVVTIGGIHGTVKSIADNTVKLCIATGVDIIVEKNGIMPEGSAPEQR